MEKTNTTKTSAKTTAKSRTEKPVKLTSLTEIEPRRLPRPNEIKEYLDRYVIGQESAKRTLSVAVYNHYKRMYNNENFSSGVEIDKSNIILLGNTGCGKTLMAKTIARMMGVPCYIQDCTKLTASGYVGEDVENCLVGLLRECKYDIDLAQRGIVVLDEGDKIAKREAGPSITRDVSGECVQQSLLKIVEGDIVNVPPQGGRKHPEQSFMHINTKNILFIISGAFVGLEDIVRQRLVSRRIGFAEGGVGDASATNWLNYTSPQDLRQFGLIPELIGRFPIITSVDPLLESDLVRILTEPRNAIISQYTRLMDIDNIELRFEPEALLEIAAIANRLHTGARGLRSIIECVLADTMFDSPSKASSRKRITETITRQTVRDAISQKFVFRDVV